MGRGHRKKHVNTRFSPYQEIGAVSVASSSVATASTDISATVATVAAAAASSSSSPFGAVHYSDSDSDESVGFYGPTQSSSMLPLIPAPGPLLDLEMSFTGIPEHQQQSSSSLRIPESNSYN